MFNRFRRKLYISLFASVVFVLAIMFISTSVYLSRIIKEDFEKRAQSLCTQYAGSISYRLASVSEAISFFQNEYRLYEYFRNSSEQSFINAALPYAKSYDLCIRGTSVIAKNGDIFFSDFGHNEAFLKSTLSEAFLKKLVKGEAYKKNHLYKTERGDQGMINITPVKNGRTTFGWLITDIDLMRIISDYNFSGNFFLRESTITISDGKENLLVYDGGSISGDSSKISFSENGVTVRFGIFPSGTHKKQIVFIIILTTVFLFLIIVCIFALRLLTKQITQPLDSLHIEMNDYIKNIKSGKLTTKKE